MSRPPECYDSSRKKFFKKKRKRFERPRFRVPTGGEKCQTALERRLRTTSDPDPISQVEEKSLFSEVASEYVISDKHKQYEDCSSTQDEFFDAQDDGVLDVNKVASQSAKNEIKVRLSVKGPLINVSVASSDGSKTVEISRNDFQKSGVNLMFSTDDDNSPCLIVSSQGRVVYGRGTSDWQSGDCVGLPARINAEAQTAVVLGTDEITDTEEISVMSHRREQRIEPDQQKWVEQSFSLPNESFMTSETTEDNVQSLNSAPPNKSEGSCDEGGEEDSRSECQLISKPKSQSSISSIPLDTYSAFEKKSNADVSIDFSTQNDNHTKEVSSAVRSVPLIKSKSDSLVLSSATRSRQKCDHDAKPRKEMFSLIYGKGEEDDWDYTGKRANYCSSNEWFNEKSYPQEYGIEKTVSEITEQLYRPEEALERPMTSAADAVKSMHQALKPISDQINDIRTKMIGMNIQPRSSSRQQFGHRAVTTMSSQESNFSSQSMRINHWLLTDPQEFSSSRTNSDGSFKGCEYLVEDFGLSGMKPRNRFREKLVIFPSDLNKSDFNYSLHSNMDDISLARSSIVTEPEDIFSKSYRGPRKKREM